MFTDFKGKKLIHILDVPVGHVCLYGRFPEVELGLALLTVVCVHMWISTEKSLFLFCILKVVIYLYCLRYKREGRGKMKL